MSFASGARVQYTYVVESTPGTTPASPTMKVLRLSSFDINPTKGELRSNEVLSDRQTISLRHGMRGCGGTLGGELALQVHDDMIEAALSGTWAGSIANSTDIGITNPDQVVRAAGSFITDGFRPGDVVVLGSLAASSEDGNYLATTVSALAMTLVNLDGTTINLTTEAASATPTVAMVGNRCEVGTTLRQYSMERGFLDIGQYEVFRGVAINTLGLNIQPEEIPTITYGVIGMDFDAMTGTPLDASPTAAPTNEAMSPFSGGIYEGTARIATLTGLTLDLNNNRTTDGVIGATSSPAVFEGDAVVTGQVTALFEDAGLYNKFVNETETSLWVRLLDPADTTQFLNIVVPRIKYTGNTKAPPKSGPIIQTMPFGALKHSVTGTTLSVQRSNV